MHVVVQTSTQSDQRKADSTKSTLRALAKTRVLVNVCKNNCEIVAKIEKIQSKQKDMENIIEIRKRQLTFLKV